jgi:hypothetical protein
VGPGAEQSAVLVATYANVPAGHHTVSLTATALQGGVSMSFVQLTAVAVRSSP